MEGFEFIRQFDRFNNGVNNKKYQEGVVFDEMFQMCSFVKLVYFCSDEH